MKTSIQKLPKSKIEISVEVSARDFNNYYQQTLFDLSKTVSIKGFRPGHIPSEVLEKQVGQEEILNQAVQKAIKDKYIQIIKENNLEVVEKPKIKILKLPYPNFSPTSPKTNEDSDNSLIFKIETSVLPEVNLPDYKKAALSTKKEKIEVQAEEIEKALKWLQNSRAKFSALKREARKGDFIDIEYWFSQIEEGRKKKDGFILGQGHFIPGFEENLEGLKAGEVKEDFPLVIPEGHFMKDLAGKKINFGVKIISVFKTELPELNDNFAKSLGNFKDLKSLKENIKEGLEAEKEKEAKIKFREKILEKIIDSINWEIPESLIEGEKDRLFNDFKEIID